MSTREGDAWEIAETFIAQFNTDTGDQESMFIDRDPYFGYELFKPTPKIMSISLPPEPKSPSDLNVPVTVVIRVTIPKGFNNRVEKLHGGAASTIFDNLNSVAVAVWANCCAPSEEMQLRWFQTGVSRTLNVSYLRPVKVGSEVDVWNEVVSVGKSLVLIRGKMTDPKTGKIICTSEHHKATTYQSNSKL